MESIDQDSVWSEDNTRIDLLEIEGATMSTPSLTLEDGAGAAAALAGLGMASQSSSEAVQLAAVIGIGIIGALIVAAGAYRRGKRAEFMTTVVVEESD